jgi:hypothetical protein
MRYLSQKRGRESPNSHVQAPQKFNRKKNRRCYRVMLSGAKHLGFDAEIGKTMPEILRFTQDDNCLV